MSWTAVLYNPYNSTTEAIYAMNGSYRHRIEDDQVFDWGIDAPDTIPSVAVGASTGLTGEYNAKYTFCRKERNSIVCESNASIAAAAAVDLTDESFEIEASVPKDRQVNCIGFYRTLTDGATYYLDQYLNYVTGDYACCHGWEADDEYITGWEYRFTTENITDKSEDCFTWEILRSQYSLSDTMVRATSPADNIYEIDDVYVTVPTIDTDTADASLGTELHTDHDRPPKGSFIAGPTFNGTLFAIDGNKLYYSKVKQPEYWPSTSYINVGSPQFPGKCVIFYNKAPFYLTKREIYFIYGTSSTDFMPYRVAAKTGTQSVYGGLGVEGYGIFHIGSDGLYLYSPTSDYATGKDDKITGAFDEVFRGNNTNGVTGAGDLSNSWLVYWEDKLYFGYPGGEDSYPQNILVFYLAAKRVGYFTRNEPIHAVAVDDTNNRLLAADRDGYMWVIEDKTVTDDDGTAIEWEVESKDFTLQTRRHFPRWCKYDVDASDSDSASGEIFLDDSSLQTHTITGDRVTRRRLITTGNGKRMSVRISGSGPVEIYAAEAE